jgi:hypothetical protein
MSLEVTQEETMGIDQERRHEKLNQVTHHLASLRQSKQRVLETEDKMSDEYSQISFEVMLGVCADDSHPLTFSQAMQKIDEEIAETEALLQELREERREKVLTERLKNTGLQPQDKSAKPFMTVPMSDPIQKAFQKAEDGRKTRKKIKLDEARRQAREQKNQRLQEIIHEFGLDPNAKWTMVEFDVPSEDELEEMRA